MLTLPIKRKWFDMIMDGTKKEEYREKNRYYMTRFKNLPRTMIDGKAQAFIALRAGYRADSPKCYIRCWIDAGTGRTEWGAEPGKEYIRLHIESVSTANNAA